ncbi:MAG: prepilin-type N-terminal cleavage/methylation domain-containing protein [Kiritimatiellia bacterium]|jgi:prepilin-type N-terminal cleavage/methylation domain-containing protein
MRNTKLRGFTLIELLVVIAIIALLATLLTPVLLKSIRKGKQAKALHLVDQVSQALQSYRTEYKQWPPLFSKLPKNREGDYFLSVPATETTGHPAWNELLVTLLARAETDEEKVILEANNIRRLRFLDVEPHMTNRPDDPLKATSLVDPWNQQLNLVFDGNGDEIISGLPDKKSGDPTGFKTYGEIGIWSWGHAPKKVKNCLTSWK